MRKINQTTLFIFLKVLSVLAIGVKTSKKVYVRRDDKIVLNCTCFRENNGNWKGPNISSLSNHFIEENIIPYATGLTLNPKLNGSNVHVVGNYERNTCKLVINNFSVLNEGIYKCQYVKNNATNIHVFKVLVIYPPDLTLHMYNLSDGIKLTCNASGIPNSYTFENWEQRSEVNQHIRYLKGTHDGNLSIQNNQYQNSGIYICNVTNGVSSRNGNSFQTRHISIPYEGTPMFVFGNDRTQFGQYGKEINIAFNIFSSSEIRVTIIKTNRIHTFEALVEPYNSTCKGYLEFHGVNITIVCTRFSFSFGTDGLKNYTVEVCNKHGCINRVIEIVSENDHFKLTYVDGYCWIIMGSLAAGIAFLCGCLHIFCYIKRAKTVRKTIHINSDDSYDEVETYNYYNAIFDHTANNAEVNNDNLSCIIESNDIVLRNDAVSSDDSSLIKQSGDGYENPYQAINPCDIDMHHYSNIVSSNYQNTIIFPPNLSKNTSKYLNISMDSLINHWLVIYKRKQ